MTVRIEGWRSIVAAAKASGDQIDVWLREGLLEIGEKVAVDVRRRYAPKSERGAAGVKAKVTRPGTLLVAQTLRRSRDLNRRRGSFGGYEMRHAFLPALAESEPEVRTSLQKLLDRLGAIWND